MKRFLFSCLLAVALCAPALAQEYDAYDHALDHGGSAPDPERAHAPASPARAQDPTETTDPAATAAPSADAMMQPSPSVADATRQALAALQNNDADGVRDAFAESDALVAIGTDPAEYFRGHAQTTDVFTAQANAVGGMTVDPGDAVYPVHVRPPGP